MSFPRDLLNPSHLRRARASRALPRAVLLAALVAPLAPHLPAQAAILGDAQVRSYLGQKLDAEIEISALTATEAEALLVRIPGSDAFAAAGVDMTALVRSLRVTLEKRGEQTVVRVHSDQAVNDPFVLLLLELNAGGTRTVRQYALLIDPAPLERPPSVNVEPAIAEPQAQESTTAAAPSSIPALMADKPAATSAGRFTASTTRRVRSGETLAAIGNELKPDGVRLEQVLVALQRANPQAFAGNNINRMKSGSVLSVPSADSMRAIDANDARRIVIAQSSDFRRYSEVLAERMNTPAAHAGDAAAGPAAGNRSSSGSVGVQVREPGARAEPQDQLKLTAPGQTSANGATKAKDNDGSNDKQALDRVATDKALADANARIAALEKNLGRMAQMLELRDRKLAEAQKAAEPANSSAPPSLAATRDAWLDDMQQPVVRIAAAGLALLGLLALLIWSRARRQGGRPARKRGKVNLVGSATASASTAAAPVTEPSSPDSAEAPMAAAAVGSTPTHAVKSRLQGQVQGGDQPGSEVDPIAEADVYIAYGRDEQAEEILRDALREQPQSPALRVKLLEIYAARRDRKAYANAAAELHAVTGGKGSAWEQAAQMGQLLDPGHPLYAGPRQSATASEATEASAPRATAAPAPRSPLPPLQAVPSTDQRKPQPASSVDDFGLKLEGLLDEQRRESGRQPLATPAPMQRSSISPPPDFSLSGIAQGNTSGKRIEPTLEGERDTATLNTKFDLALACEEIGDHEGARELLSEVAAARDPELSRRAQDMLRKMA